MADILGIIGGSGFYEMEGLRNVRRVTVRTPFGEPSDSLTVGDLQGRTLAFLPRHGRGHRLSPSQINYRANVYALKKIGVDAILSIAAWPAEKLAVVSDEEIFGVRQLRRVKSGEGAARARARLFDLQELKRGDLVVHADHGIGQYDGLQKLRVDAVRNDFLVLIYQGGDKLYLPVDRMGMIQKYMGVEGHSPSLDKMGGRSWERMKARVKRSAEKMAGELLRLYAQRRVESGFQVQSVDGYLHDFETGFAFEETPDQLKAID